LAERLIRSAIQYAVANKRKSLTLVHKGNIQKFTEGAFRNWGYQLAESPEFAADPTAGSNGNGPRLPAGRRTRTPRWMPPARPARSS